MSLERRVKALESQLAAKDSYKIVKRTEGESEEARAHASLDNYQGWRFLTGRTSPPVGDNFRHWRLLAVGR